MQGFTSAVLLALLALAAPVTAAEPEARLEPVPARGASEGDGPFRQAGDPRRDPDRRQRRAAARAGRHRHRRQPDRRASTGAGTPGLPLTPDREPRDADREIDATGMYVLPGFVDTHGHNGDPDKAPQRRATATGSGWRTASPRCAACRSITGPTTCRWRTSAQRRQHDRRAAPVRLCGARRRLGRRRRRHAGAGARLGPLGGEAGL